MDDLIFAADSHLNAEGDDTERFLRFLRVRGPTARTLVLVGDIFDLWIARRGLELPIHRAVVQAVTELNDAGVQVKYVQGNRDYYVAERYSRGPFAAVAEDSLRETQGGTRIHVSHGDLVNLNDRQYRMWRGLSRSAPFRLAFSMIPAGPAARLSAHLERRFRTTNEKYRLAFPEPEVRNYAGVVFREGADAIVLGHFHQERVMEFPGESGTRRLYVLPGWREDRRYLRFDRDGVGRFEDFED